MSSAGISGSSKTTNDGLYVAKSVGAAKGDVLGFSASATPVAITKGADYNSLISLASASSGSAFHPMIPMCIASGRTGMAAGSGAFPTTHELNYCFTTGNHHFVVPVGWRFLVYAMTCHCAGGVGGSGQTVDVALFVDGSTVQSNFTTWQLTTAMGANAVDSSFPTVATVPYAIDATSAEKRVSVRITTSATTSSITLAASVMGILTTAP